MSDEIYRLLADNGVIVCLFSLLFRSWKWKRDHVSAVLCLLAVTHIIPRHFQPNPTAPEKGTKMEMSNTKANVHIRAGPFTDGNLTLLLTTTTTKLKIFSFMVESLKNLASYQQKALQNLSTRFEKLMNQSIDWGSTTCLVFFYGIDGYMHRVYHYLTGPVIV